MKLRIGHERTKGFSSPVKKAEEVNDWSWWAFFVAVIVMIIIVILKMLGKI